MVSEKFKSKAKNIALKSFLFEMKKLKLYPYIVYITVIYLYSPKILNAIIPIITESSNKRIIDLETKNIFPKVLKRFETRIKNEFYHSSEKTEYQYLTCCVNSYIKFYLDNIICCHRDLRKDLDIEMIGRTIFIRAGKKIFGENFEFQEPVKPETYGDLFESLYGDVQKKLHDLLASRNFNYLASPDEIIF